MARVFPNSSIPIIEHLTYQEAHRFLRGAWIGFAVALGLLLDQRAFAFALVERAHKRMQAKHEVDSPDRLAGLKRDAWYLFSGVILSFLVVSGVLYALGMQVV